MTGYEYWLFRSMYILFIFLMRGTIAVTALLLGTSSCVLICYKAFARFTSVSCQNIIWTLSQQSCLGGIQFSVIYC